MLIIKHIAGVHNDVDIFIKNVMSAVFNFHVPLYVGLDEYGTVCASAGLSFEWGG